jgi:hypothetical protein
MHNSTGRRFKYPSYSHDAASPRHLHRPAEAHHQAIDSRAILTVDMDAEVGEQEEEAHPARTGHHPWTDRHVTAHHRVECRRIEDSGDVVGAEVVVVDEEGMAEGHDRIAGLEVGRRGEACHALLIAVHPLGRLHDEEAEEVDMVGATVLHGEAVAAAAEEEEVEVGAGEAPATVRTEAPVPGIAAGAETADEQLELVIRKSGRSRDRHKNTYNLPLKDVSLSRDTQAGSLINSRQ